MLAVVALAAVLSATLLAFRSWKTTMDECQARTRGEVAAMRAQLEVAGR